MSQPPPMHRPPQSPRQPDTLVDHSTLFNRLLRHLSHHGPRQSRSRKQAESLCSVVLYPHHLSTLSRSSTYRRTSAQPAPHAQFRSRHRRAQTGRSTSSFHHEEATTPASPTSDGDAPQPPLPARSTFPTHEAYLDALNAYVHRYPNHQKFLSLGDYSALVVHWGAKMERHNTMRGCNGRTEEPLEESDASLVLESALHFENLAQVRDNIAANDTRAHPYSEGMLDNMREGYRRLGGSNGWEEALAWAHNHPDIDQREGYEDELWRIMGTPEPEEKSWLAHELQLVLAELEGRGDSDESDQLVQVRALYAHFTDQEPESPPSAADLADALKLIRGR